MWDGPAVCPELMLKSNPIRISAQSLFCITAPSYLHSRPIRIRVTPQSYSHAIPIPIHIKPQSYSHSIPHTQIVSDYVHNDFRGNKQRQRRGRALGRKMSTCAWRECITNACQGPRFIDIRTVCH